MGKWIDHPFLLRSLHSFARAYQIPPLNRRPRAPFQRENRTRLVTALIFALTVSASAQSNGQELKRADLTGTDMEIIVSVVDVPPGNELPRHTHHGEEAVYVLDGATLSLPDGKEVSFPAGRVSINKRDVPHAGFKIAGDKTLKMLTVHIVEKGKPLVEPAH
ncbi:cupin domain-containing protein [Bradyrhizobium sp. CW12]|nr:cupin domain-containing protein [Bradyrhizobium sp. CW12]MCK1643758.1 cupin domain-containing protein [Bradyrhizobium sp. 154]